MVDFLFLIRTLIKITLVKIDYKLQPNVKKYYDKFLHTYSHPNPNNRLYLPPLQVIVNIYLVNFCLTYFHPIKLNKIKLFRDYFYLNLVKKLSCKHFIFVFYL